MFVLKSKAIPKIKGGMSQILVACLDACWDTQGHEFRWAGVRLQLHSGQDLHVWAELGGVIADEEALHVSFANKGHAGWRPCMLCRNVYLQRLTREPGPHDVPHTCTRFRDLRMHTTETHQTIARMLADRARGRKAALEDAETEVGWNFVPDSILWNPRWSVIASPSKSVLYDFMHIYFVSGIFNLQGGHMMQHMKRHAITAKMMDAFVKLWTWPKAAAQSAGKDVFEPKRFASSWKEWTLKCTASEGLSIGPLLDVYCFNLQVNVDPDLRKHATCFNLLWIVVKLLITSTRPPGRCDVRRDELQLPL